MFAKIFGDHLRVGRYHALEDYPASIVDDAPSATRPGPHKWLPYWPRSSSWGALLAESMERSGEHVGVPLTRPPAITPWHPQREWSDQNIGRKAGFRALPIERGLAAAYVTATMKPSKNAVSSAWASSGKTWATY
jgi:hypothetical protein